MSGLVFRERPAASGEPEGLLVLHHGRGADEHDLLGSATCSTRSTASTSSPHARR